MNEEFDLEAFDQKWNEEMAELENEETENVVDESADEGTMEDTEQLEESESESEQQEEETQENDTPDLTDNQKRDAAFAQLRRERDEAAKQAAFLQKIAEDNGMTVEDVIARYEQAQLEAESEEKNVPVDVLQRLKQLEYENELMKQQTFSERFNAQVESTMKKYNASEDDIKATFEYAAQNGLTEVLKAGGTSFEAVYKMAHMDSMIEKQVQAALQDSMSKKKKRQQEAPLKHGTGAEFTTVDLEDKAVADAKALLESGGFL